MLFYNSPSTDPYYNLALEEYLFEHRDLSQGLFMLWQNHNTLVIGKYQNTAEEINADFVKAQNTSVVRRNTGGGAVYHDMGNVNFTCMQTSDNTAGIDFRTFMEPVINALRGMGLPAEFNSRNDMTIDGKKFSGNSQMIRGNRVLHHGTLLFSANLEFVGKALRPREDKYTSKGIQSVRSRVTNLVDYMDEPISLEEFKQRLIREFFTGREMQMIQLTEEEEQAVLELRGKKYITWEWNYGKSPAFTVTKTRRFEGGTLDIYIETEKESVIRSITFRGDFFGGGDISDLEKALAGRHLEKGELMKALAMLPVSRYIFGMTAEMLTEAIVS